MSEKLTEEEKGKARVIATMCGGVIPAWAMPEGKPRIVNIIHGGFVPTWAMPSDDKEETDDEPNEDKR